MKAARSKPEVGAGADFILAGQGRDIVFGGAGANRFYYLLATDSAPGKPNADVIRDFSTAEADQIDLSSVYPGTLAYVGAAAFGGVGAGEVRVIADGADQLVQVDVNGDGAAYMEITVKDGTLAGGAGDFAL